MISIITRVKTCYGPCSTEYFRGKTDSTDNTPPLHPKIVTPTKSPTSRIDTYQCKSVSYHSSKYCFAKSGEYLHSLVRTLSRPIYQILNALKNSRTFEACCSTKQ
ncbi:hypothetical protein M758_3G081100 [Ceratodon purpureus]|uniref:Uncharacterized protein n=1 Tax=Ceratodon purpureus TaxID=3225 RepID=A0A8T0IIT6_CERPU|nr:hypothetical protein KC19_3G079900 [Ceratodon purpureus]KAG0622219.1 hypothetical protein M758_3G081100 [Ceratodon purpureus]